MKVLIACEYSGIVREEFKKLGHDAWSCDILDTEIPGNHIKDDVLKHLNLEKYKCGEGHSTYRKDCRIEETKKIIKKYIEEQS